MRITRFATATLLAASLLLFLDLFLDWHRTGIDLPTVSVHAGSMGWNGWGIAAGLTVVALVAWEASQLREAAMQQGDLLVSAVLGVLVAGFTLGAFFGDTRVGVGPMHVDVTGRLWPAYVGVVLALAVAASALVRLVEDVLGHPGRAAPTV